MTAAFSDGPVASIRGRVSTRQGLALFFVLAFALPWLVWGTSIAEQNGLIGWHLPSALAFWLGLTIATYLTAFLTGGWRAVVDLLLRMVRVRVRPTSYVFAVIITPVLAALTWLIGLLLPAATVAPGVAVAAGALLPLALFNIFMWLITEETAWRGFALPRLQRRFNPLVASVVLGVAWGVWHLPLFFIAGSFQSTVPFAGFLLSTIATSVIVGWLFNRSRGSVLIAAIFHGCTDVAIAFSGVMTSGSWPFWVFVGLQVAGAAAVARGLSRAPRRV